MARTPTSDRSKQLTSDQLEEVRARLAQRPQDAAFTAAEAAIYTGRSTRTLKRAIDAGVGPRREKNPDISGLGAANRHTSYRKADLDAWRESLVAFATDFRDFDDLAADAPWVVEGDRITGHLLDLADIDVVLQVLNVNEVVFLRLDEALRRRWLPESKRESYGESFDRICSETMQAVRDAQALDAMETRTASALAGSKPVPRP